MNIYVAIAIAGLFLKLWISHFVFIKHTRSVLDENRALFITALIFVLYSIPQILLLADHSWAESLGLARYQVLRIYYYHGSLCLIAGLYIVLSLLDFRFHKSLWVAVLVTFYAVIGAYIFLLSDVLVATTDPTNSLQVELGAGSGFPLVLATRITVAVLMTIALVVFYRRYQTAKSNQSQIINFYILAAGLLFYINCIASLLLIHPLIFATRGIFFFAGTMLIANERKLLDVRPLAPITKESKATRDTAKIFMAYLNEEISHRDAIKQIEQEMVRYKLSKITSFKDQPGSSLPLVAQSMQLSLSSLYDLINRLELERPDK